MWYVEEFLLPSLEEQGAENVSVWLDDRGMGCLSSCMEAFASCSGDGGTWHLQDDVLLCRDFAERCRDLDARGVVYGFCCRQFGDNPKIRGEVYMPDTWHSFQCVRIPDAWARGCADWYFSGAWHESPSDELELLEAKNSGDDTFFREFLLCRHGRGTAYNAAPSLVEHVDLLLGGSVVNVWRGFWARSDLWEDEELVAELRRAIKRRKQP